MLYGFTLNMPYTTKKEILEKLTETETHLTEDNNLEIVLVVRCFEIACNIFSVWVFLGTVALKNIW